MLPTTTMYHATMYHATYNYHATYTTLPCYHVPVAPLAHGLAWLGFGRLAWFALARPRLSQLASPQLGLSQEQQQQPAFGGL